MMNIEQSKLWSMAKSAKCRKDSRFPHCYRIWVLPAGRVAIERNLEILPRSQWGATSVQSGDRYEIVHLVGGG